MKMTYRAPHLPVEVPVPHLHIERLLQGNLELIQQGSEAVGGEGGGQLQFRLLPHQVWPRNGKKTGDFLLLRPRNDLGPRTASSEGSRLAPEGFALQERVVIDQIGVGGFLQPENYSKGAIYIYTNLYL